MILYVERGIVNLARVMESYGYERGSTAGGFSTVNGAR
jgi:hypothetical protein